MAHSFNALLKVHSIKSRSFSLIRLCGNVVYKVEKSYQDKLVARNPLHINLLSTSPEFFIDQNQFLFEVSIHCQGSICPSLPGFTHGFYPGLPMGFTRVNPGWALSLILKNWVLNGSSLFLMFTFVYFTVI